MLIQSERTPAIAPGTPMWKAVPPRLVGPYLSGQRGVLAGYVYRAQDVRFHNPAEAYLTLSLGWEDSEFTRDMAELYLLCWLARTVDGYQRTAGPGVPGSGEVRMMGTDLPRGWRGLDIGPETAGAFADAVAGAGTVFWNGPMGVFEDERFAAGTRTVARAVAESPGFTVVGGGDSVAALDQLDLAARVGYVSTGGGASLDLLEHGDLPGLQALRHASNAPRADA